MRNFVGEPRIADTIEFGRKGARHPARQWDAVAHAVVCHVLERGSAVRKKQRLDILIQSFAGSNARHRRQPWDRHARKHRPTPAHVHQFGDGTKPVSLRVGRCVTVFV